MKQNLIQEVEFFSNSMTYGTRRYNTAFTMAFQKSLSQAESTQFLVLIHIYLRSILILLSHLRLGIPKYLVSVGLPVKMVKAVLLYSQYMTCPSQSSRLNRPE